MPMTKPRASGNLSATFVSQTLTSP
jgi:hypothetical protein